MALVVFGLTPFSLPLDLVFVEALPGCTWHCTPNNVEAQVLAGPVLDITFAVGNNPSLIDVQFFQPIASISLDAQ